MKNNKMKKYAITILAMIIPGAGHVILKRPVRGLFFIFWIYCLGFITYQLSSGDISYVGRLSGGIAVWVMSILEVNRILNKSVKI